MQDPLSVVNQGTRGLATILPTPKPTNLTKQLMMLDRQHKVDLENKRKAVRGYVKGLGDVVNSPENLFYEKTQADIQKYNQFKIDLLEEYADDGKIPINKQTEAAQLKEKIINSVMVGKMAKELYKNIQKEADTGDYDYEKMFADFKTKILDKADETVDGGGVNIKDFNIGDYVSQDFEFPKFFKETGLMPQSFPDVASGGERFNKPEYHAALSLALMKSESVKNRVGKYMKMNNIDDLPTAMNNITDYAEAIYKENLSRANSFYKTESKKVDIGVSTERVVQKDGTQADREKIDLTPMNIVTDFGSKKYRVIKGVIANEGGGGTRLYYGIPADAEVEAYQDVDGNNKMSVSDYDEAYKKAEEAKDFKTLNALKTLIPKYSKDYQIELLSNDTNTSIEAQMKANTKYKTKQFFEESERRKKGGAKTTTPTTKAATKNSNNLNDNDKYDFSGKVYTIKQLRSNKANTDDVLLNLIKNGRLKKSK